MLLDVAVAPGEPHPAPAALKKHVHGLLSKALRGLPAESRMAVESGSGAVVCFVGDPEDGINVALRLCEQVTQHHEDKLSIRVALNLGTVQVAIGPQEQLQIAGEGIQHAVEVRDRAGPNELLLSHSYHRLLAQLNPARAGSFVDHAPGEVQPIKVYAPSQPTGPKPETEPMPLDAAEVQEIERELAARIGPLASLLVRKMERRAASTQALREMLAAAIPPAPAPQPRAPHARDSTRQVDVTPAELEIVEHTLQRFIGPGALELILREIELCQQFREFVAAIATSVGHPQQREVFLQALHRALPERSF